MQEEIQRVLDLVTSGRLTSEQGAAMIAALKAGGETAASGASAPGSAARDDARAADAGRDREAPSGDSRGQRSERHRRRRHRHRDRHGRIGAEVDSLFENLGRDFGRVMGISAKSLRRAFGSGFLSQADGWTESSNDAVLSRAEAPSGTDFVCEDNRLVVSSLRDLSLTRSTFSGNELDAASIEGLELVDSRVAGLRLRGASLKGGLVERATLENLEMNGSRVADLTVADGRFVETLLNGAHVRELGIARSHVEASRFNATKLKTMLITGDSRVVRLETNALMGRDLLIDGSVLADVQMSGIRIDGFKLKRAGLEDVRFESDSWSADLDPRGLTLMRDVAFERVVLKRCRFIDCRFDGARLEGFEAADLAFQGVDFGAARIDSAAALARLAVQPERV